MEKFFLVYKIVNKINGKYYIGAHETFDINDGYYGSGELIKKAIKKYGLENFEKIILENCKDSKEMYETERKYVTKDVVSDPNSYNQTLGGKGISREENLARWSDPVFREKTTLSMTKYVEQNPQIRDIRSKQCSERWKTPEFREKMLKIANSDECRLKHSESAKNMWKSGNQKERDRRKSEEYKLEKAKEMNERYKNEEFRIKIAESTRNRVWMYSEKLKKNTTVKKDKVNDMISLGWKLGRNPDYFKK